MVCSAADLVPLLSGSEDSSIAPQTDGRIHSGQGLELESGAEEKKRREQNVFGGLLFWVSLRRESKWKSEIHTQVDPSAEISRIGNFC